jgi:hypothetical protein
MMKSSLPVKALITILVFVALSFILGVLAAFFIALMLAVVLFGVDCRVPYLTALLLLVVAALFQGLNSTSASEFFATWSFYFLAIGVLAQFRDAIDLGPSEDLGG